MTPLERGDTGHAPHTVVQSIRYGVNGRGRDRISKPCG